MSMPVHAVEPLIGCEWLSARTFPHYLRRSGWIYLRSEERLQARVKAAKVIWRSERKVPTDGPYEDLGPGLAIQVDPRTWDENVDIPLGVHAERQRHGFRYLKTNDDDTITHYSGGRPVAEPSEYDEDEIEL